MKCCDCEDWKDVGDNDYGTCTCKESEENGWRLAGFHECKIKKKGQDDRMEKLREQITEKIEELKENAANRHMNDLEYSRYKTLHEVLDMMDDC